MRLTKNNGRSNNLKYWFASFILTFLTGSAISQKIYYIDSQNGSDLNVGTSESAAWKSIDKLNSSMYLLKPSDIIRFKRGAIYEGQVNVTVSGTAAQPIVFEAYGNGYNPLISGTKSISAWRKYHGNMYRAKIDKNTLNAFIGNNQLVLARTPNAGNYFRINTGGTNNYFTDSDLSQANNFWAGAKCRIRTIDYTWEICSVASFANQAVTLQSNTNFTLQANQTYYFDNLLAALDTTNEWYSSGDSLYVYFANPTDTSNVFASLYDYGFTSTSRSYITIRNLSFSKQGTDGIYLVACSNFEISNNDFSDIMGRAVGLNSANTVKIIGNSMENCRGNGISGFQVSNSSFLSNNIKNIGLVPGYGAIISGMTGIYLNGDGSNNLIAGNQIENTGYNGIRSDTRNSRIENNIVKSPLMMVKDGAGIYIWGTSSNNITIRGNYVENINHVELYGYHNWSFGIYLDDYCYGNKVIGNIINDKYSPAIFLHNSYNDLVDSNTVYGTSINVANDRTVTGSTYVNTFTNNNIFTLSRNTSSLSLSSSVETSFGTFSNNVYFNPYTKVTIACKKPSVISVFFSLSKWKNYSGQDLNSKESIVKWNEYKVIDTLSNNLVVNGTFNSNLNSWDGYQSNFVREWTTHASLSGGCARMYFSALSPTYGAFRTFGYDINYKKDKFYQVSYNSTGSSFVNMYLRDSEVPSTLNERVAMENTFSHYNYTFKAASDFAGKVIFNTDAANTFTGDLYIDNVELYEVDAVPNNYSDSSKLLYNTTSSPQSFNLGANKYIDTYGNVYTGSLTIQPWKAIILIKVDGYEDPFVSTKEQNINLKAGWNVISFNIIPKEVKIEELIQSFVETGNLVKVQDEKGNFMVETDGDWFNNLDTIDIRKGYNIKVNTDCQLKVQGISVPEAIEIPLTEGYNLIGYPSSKGMQAINCFQSLITEGSLVKVQDEAGNFIIKTNNSWYSNIDSLRPGKGYYVNVNKNTGMNISNLQNSFLKNISLDETQSSDFFQKSFTGNPYASMNFIIKNINQGNISLSPGDEIGIFDGENCVGYYKYNGEEKIGVSAGMADPITETAGFVEGDSISIQIYKSTEKSLIKNVGIVFSQDQENAFVAQGTAVIELTELPTTITVNTIKQNSITNFPNPFSDYTTFEFTLEDKSEVSLAVFDLSGKEITELINQEFDAGKYEISWDGTTNNGELLIPGVYLYMFRTGNYTSAHKMIFLKQ